MDEILDGKNLLRASVERAETASINGTEAILGSYATVRARTKVTASDSSMFSANNIPAVNEIIRGTIRINAESDSVLRITYNRGNSPAANETRMIAGKLAPPSRCEIRQEGGRLYIRTACICAVVNLDPYYLEIEEIKETGCNGGINVKIGGPEKNYFRRWDTINTGTCFDPALKRPFSTENFSLAHDECIYGLGEKFIKLDKTGQTIVLNMEDGLGVTTPRSYKNIPFYMSTKRYGVFFNHSSVMTFRVGSRSACDIQVTADDTFLDYYVFTGSIKDILMDYTGLTGKGSLPPEWSFGYWQSKISYSSAAEVLDVVRGLRGSGIPCDVIHIDTHWYKTDWRCDLEFDKERFPDPATFIKELNGMGVKLSLWQLPYIPEGSSLFDELKAADGFVKNTEGGIYNRRVSGGLDQTNITGIIDYTNPKAVEIHKNAFRKLFKLGVSVIKTDFGEAAPADGIYYDGTPGYQMHNLYPLLYNKALSEVTAEQTGSAIVWARSAWAGNQRYPVHWGGDNSPEYPDIAPQIAGGLSFGLSGFQFWSMDIGGFMGDTYDDILIRWMQIGMFMSHSRIHGVGIRELYKFKPETVRICRDYIRLKYKLMPYIYGSAAKCLLESLPMLRALVVDFQEDRNVHGIYDQYLFGDSLMIAPFFEEKPSRRDVYLPAGTWTDWWTGRRIKAAGTGTGTKAATGKGTEACTCVCGCWIKVDYDLEKMPVFIREGAIIPMGPAMNYTGEVKTTEIDLSVSLFESFGSNAGNAESSFIIPVGGKHIRVAYVFSGGTHIISIERSDIKINIRPLGGEMKDVIVKYI